MDLKTLDQIAIANETDKATQFTRTYAKPHGYTLIYDRFFTPIRDKEIKLLEIGCAGGESVRTWLEYFPAAKVFSVDIVKDTNIWNSPNPAISPHPRYTFVHGDQSVGKFWKEFISEHGGNWNVIVDDGSHIDEHVNLTLEKLWPYMTPGGLYCIEDMKSLLHPMRPFGSRIEDMHQGEGDLAEVHFSRELAVMVKRA